MNDDSDHDKVEDEPEQELPEVCMSIKGVSDSRSSVRSRKEFIIQGFINLYEDRFESVLF